jgi:3-hydroxybutyryl-CoA dehydratase
MPKELEPVKKQITQEMINQYADAIGDYNPIHVDEEFAKTTQFGGTIAHGTLLLAFIGELMTKELGKEWIERGGIKVRFKAPAKPGDTIIASATPRGDQFSVKCHNQNGELLVAGTAKINKHERTRARVA